MIELNQYSLPDKIAAEDRLGIFRDFTANERTRVSRKGNNNLAQGTTQEAMDKLARVFS